MKRTRLLFLSLVCLLGTAATAAAQGTISGKVTDESGHPLEDAMLFISGASDTAETVEGGVFATTNAVAATTDRNGRYSISDLPTGRYVLTAFHPGKKIVSRTATVESGDRELDFELLMLEGLLEGELVVSGDRRKMFGFTRLKPVEGVTINEAKKNEVVVMDGITANLATNNARQIYRKVAGLNIWESDGTGVQLGIGGRGLSPNRSSNFNTRQNGYDIAADALGYPESYYTPPAQALERIEMIRGAASLQYGTQFGGLLNFVLKDGPEHRPMEVTSSQSFGSGKLYTLFNSAGGTSGDWSYYGYHQYKTSEGWRPNSEMDQHTGYFRLQHDLTRDLSLSADYTHMRYLARQPGGLTDAQFEQNPFQSNRERNWFRVNWNLFSLEGDYRLSGMTRLNTRFFGLIAGRDAVGNLGRIDRQDFGGNRDLLKDDFRNWGNETRLIHRYPLGDAISVFLAGTRYYRGFTHRRQGEGSDGSGPDFSYLQPDNLEGSDFDLPGRNASLFLENIFNLSPEFSITPGVRFEYIRTGAEGYYRTITRDLAGNVLSDERTVEDREKERYLMLYGVGLSYKKSERMELYANYSRNYRAITFNDIRVDIGSLEVDPDIGDERGYNLDLGIRGAASDRFNYDVSLFHLSYEDRIGTVLRTEPNPVFNNLVDRTFRYRTNIADASIYGLESFAELDILQALVPRSGTRLSLFGNLALISARYSRSEENGIEGNRVEQVPEVNLKTGLTFARGNVEVTGQYSFTGEHYSDASNAIRTPTAIEGVIPAYHVIDLSAGYGKGRISVDLGVNNLADHRYFTRRATGYPGPGIIPAEGRSFYLTVGVTL